MMTDIHAYDMTNGMTYIGPVIPGKNGDANYVHLLDPTIIQTKDVALIDINTDKERKNKIVKLKLENVVAVHFEDENDGLNYHQRKYGS